MAETQDADIVYGLPAILADYLYFSSFLWLPEEVLTLLFLLHRENRDFSILMKDIF